jgi:hypothetical protein
MRQLLARIADGHADEADAALKRMWRKQPARAYSLWMKTVAYVMPRPVPGAFFTLNQQINVGQGSGSGAGRGPACTSEDVLSAWRAAPSLPAPSPAAEPQDRLSPPAQPQPRGSLLEVGPQGAAAPDASPAPSGACKAPRPQREEPAIDATPDASGVWSAPNPSAQELVLARQEGQRRRQQEVLERELQKGRDAQAERERRQAKEETRGDL